MWLAAPFSCPLDRTEPDRNDQEAEVLPWGGKQCAKLTSRKARVDSYVPTNISFLSNQQFAYAAAVFGIHGREKPAANLSAWCVLGQALMLARVDPR